MNVPQMKSQVEKLRAKVQLLNAQGAALRAEQSNKSLQFLNGMSDLVAAEQFRQENITSIAPLVNNNIYAQLTLQYNTLMYMYSTHGVIQTAIDEPVMDAHRDEIGLTCKDGLSYRNLEELEQWLEENEVWEPFRDTQIWGRTFGGGAMVINVAGDPSKPMNLKDIERGRFALYAAARWELGSTWRHSDTYNFYGMNFDKSRVLTFIGKRMPWIIERQLSGWGASLIARMAEDFNMFLKTRNVLYEILNDAKIDVYRLDGYTNNLATQQGTADVDRRIAMTNSLKSFHSALILDKLDEFEQKQLSFAGIADVMRENRIGLCSATRMPFSKIFGTTAGGTGLANSGQDDLENYNAMVTSEVRKPARPLLKQILRLGGLALFGKEYHIDFEYPPLRIMGAKEEEEVKTSAQNRIISALEAGLIDEKGAADWMRHEKLIPVENGTGRKGEKDVPSRGGRKNDEQGADYARQRGGQFPGDGRQVPRYG
jgi:phage-related protein (TIGR01555 family)